MMAEEPTRFRECVQESLRRQVDAINKLTSRGMYFFDYGNASCSRPRVPGRP
mgnify:CR=1 FL=1